MHSVISIGYGEMWNEMHIWQLYEMQRCIERCAGTHNKLTQVMSKCSHTLRAILL